MTYASYCSSKHNSVAITRTVGGTFREPRFDNVHGRHLLFLDCSHLVSPRLSSSLLVSPRLSSLAVATFSVVAANKNKAQERLSELRKKIG